MTCGLGYSSGLALGGILYQVRCTEVDDGADAISSSSVVPCPNALFLQVGGFKLPFLFIGIFVLLLIVPCGLTVCRISELASASLHMTLYNIDA